MEKAFVKNKKKFKFSSSLIGQIISVTIVTIFLILVLYPIFLMIIKSFKDATQEMHDPLTVTFPLYFQNYKFAWLYVKGYILNTFIIAVSVTLGSVFICSITAYGFVRFDFRFKEVLFMFILALMMIPGVLTLIPQYALANNLNLINTRIGVIIPTIAGSIPYGTFLLRTFFNSISKDLFDAAEIDGANNLYQYAVIAIPLALPIVFTLGLTSFMGAWNDLIWPTLILTKSKLQTISVGLVPFTEDFMTKVGSMGVPLAGYVIVSLPLVIIFAFTSKQFVAGLTSGAIKM